MAALPAPCGSVRIWIIEPSAPENTSTLPTSTPVDVSSRWAPAAMSGTPSPVTSRARGGSCAAGREKCWEKSCWPPRANDPVPSFSQVSNPRQFPTPSWFGEVNSRMSCEV